MLLKDKYELPVEEIVSPPKYDDMGKLFMQAARIIRQRGWCQRQLCNDVGNVCIVGAVWNVKQPSGNVAHDKPYISQLEINARNHLIELGFGPEWNDMEGRTKEQVIGALEFVAGKHVIRD